MSDKQLYILASYDAETEKYFAGLQQKLYGLGFEGRQTRGLPMHITLGSFPTECEAELCEKVREAARTTAPFELTFNHISLFQGAQVLFVAPDVSAELLRLKENFGSSFGWTAHTTLLIDEPATIYRALPPVMDDFRPHLGRVTALHLYEFFPTRHILSVDLKEETL